MTVRHIKELHGVVFDLGCGSKPYQEEICSVASEYIGIDWSNTIHGLNADIVADLNNELPVASESADAVVSFQVLEHLSEPQRMLHNAFRILKPGGKICLSVPFQWHVHEAPHDYFRYTKYGLEYLFKKAGFKAITVEAVTGFWVMWALKFNYQTKRLVRGPLAVRIVMLSIFIPIWWVNQYLAIFFDLCWRSESETAGYFVTAIKS